MQAAAQVVTLDAASDEVPSPVLLAASGSAVNISITDLKIKTNKMQDTTSMPRNYYFYTSINWDAGSQTLHEGDYVDIKLPDQMKFTNGGSTFDVADDSGNVVAHAVVTSNADGGGTVRMTFTDYVNNHYNIKGVLNIRSQFVRSKVNPGENNTFTVETGGKKTSTTIEVTDPNKPNNETVGKWSERVAGHDDQASWYVRINHMKSDLTNVTISDNLTSNLDLDGIEYIAGSFELWKVEYNEYGEVMRVIEKNNISNDVQIGSDGTSFTYNAGDLHTDQYMLTYKTTYKPGTGMQLFNNVKLNSTEKTEGKSSKYPYENSDGTGDGSLFSKIKIVKVDKDDNTVKLAGAVFQITSVTNPLNTFTLTTDANGEAISDKLGAGQYTIKELIAPDGYELDDQTYTVHVVSDAATIKTVKDTKKPVEPPVTPDTPSTPDNPPTPDSPATPQPESPAPSVMPVTGDVLPFAAPAVLMLGAAGVAGVAYRRRNRQR